MQDNPGLDRCDSRLSLQVESNYSTVRTVFSFYKRASLELSTAQTFSHITYLFRAPTQVDNPLPFGF